MQYLLVVDALLSDVPANSWRGTADWLFRFVAVFDGIVFRLRFFFGNFGGE